MLCGKSPIVSCPLASFFLFISFLLLCPSQALETGGMGNYKNHSFSFRLFGLVDDSANNTLFSPYAVGNSLHYLALGSNEDAQKQIYNALGVDLSNKKSSETSHDYFNALFGASSAWALPSLGDIESEFAKRLETLAGHEFFKASLDSINMWTKEASQETIPSIINLLPPGSAVVPLSLSNFQLNLDDLLSDTASSEILVDHKVFYVNSDQLIKTKFFICDASMSHVGADSFDAYYFPGALENVNVYFFVPRDPSGIREFILRLSPVFFKSLIDELRLIPRRSFVLELPSVEIVQYGSLKLPLQGLGIFDSFSHSKSSLSVSVSSSDYLSDFLYAVRFVVSHKDAVGQESHSEAESLGSSSLLQPLSLALNKPFLMVVTDSKSDNILFLAKVLKPPPVFKTN